MLIAKRVAKSLVLTLIFGFVIIITTTPNVSAQTTSPVIKINEAAANSDVTVEPLRDNLSVLFGSGGNIIVLNGPDGKLLVDDGTQSQRIRFRLRSIELAQNRSSTSSTRTGIGTTPTATSGCTTRARRSSHTRTSLNIYVRPLVLKIGTIHSNPGRCVDVRQ
jgi:hypothetical protein